MHQREEKLRMEKINESIKEVVQIFIYLKYAMTKNIYINKLPQINKPKKRNKTTKCDEDNKNI